MLIAALFDMNDGTRWWFCGFEHPK